MQYFRVLSLNDTDNPFTSLISISLKRDNEPEKQHIPPPEPLMSVYRHLHGKYSD